MCTRHARQGWCRHCLGWSTHGLASARARTSRAACSVARCVWRIVLGASGTGSAALLVGCSGSDFFVALLCKHTHTDGAGGGDACSTTGSGAILRCQIFGSPGIARRWPHTSRWYHCASHAVKKRTAHPYMRPLQLAVVKLTEILMLHFFLAL